MPYRDFTLRIGAAGSRFRARVIESPAGERAACTFELPFAPGELTGLLRALGRAVRAVVPGDGRHVRPVDTAADALARADVDELGRKLSAALFQGEVRDRFLQSLVAIGPSGGQGLRVKLRLDLSEEGATRLHRVPWELLASPETGRPLALSRRTPLVRYLEAPGTTELPPAPETLEVRLVAAQPAGTGRLDLEGEQGALRATLGEGAPIALSAVPLPTLTGIVEALRGGGVHVLHFMGHGDLDLATDQGTLVLEDEAGRIDRVGAGRLVELAGDYLRPLRLVFLNACRSAEASERAPFAGVATALVEAGVPAVIAMQHPVTDGAAALFASTVYRRIAAGAPIDEAVTEGRLALRDAAGRTLPDLPEWATPALFLRTGDGRLFATVEAAKERPVGPRRRRWPWWTAVATVTILTVLLVILSSWNGRSGGPEPPADTHSTTGEELGEQGADRADLSRGSAAGDGASDGTVPDPSAHPTGSPAEPAAGERSGRKEAPQTSPERELFAGRPAYFEAVGVTVTVDFLDTYGAEYVRISALPDGGSVQRAPVFGPETVELGEGGDRIAVHVLAIDWTTHKVRLSVSR